MANSVGVNAIAFGSAAYSSHTNSIAFGNAAKSAEAEAIVIGNGASSSSISSVAIGYLASVSSSGSIAIGVQATSSANRGIAIGPGSIANGEGSIVLGNLSCQAETYSIAVGDVFTSSGPGIYTMYLGNGVFSAAASAGTYTATGGNGTDKIGGIARIAGGRGTGAGAGGKVVFAVAPTTASSSSLNALEDVAWFTGTGHMVLVERTSNPPITDLTVGTHMAIYRKADKLVVSYNLAGVLQYVTLDLDGADTALSHGTTAP